MKKLLLILVLSAFGFSGCGDLLISPKKQAFYCKVDGKGFIPGKNVSWGGNPSLRVNFYKDSGALWINATNSGESVSLYVIFPNKEITIGNYELSSLPNSSTGVYSPDYAYSFKKYNAISGNFKITDFTDAKVTGTFEFIGKDSLTNELVKITNGKINAGLTAYYE